MLAHILTDCRGAGEGLTEEEEDTKEGQEVETTFGRPRGPLGISRLGLSPIR